MKAHIDKDDWYPFYCFSEGPYWSFDVDLPEEVLARWKKAESDFIKAQKEIEKYDPLFAENE